MPLYTAQLLIVQFPSADQPINDLQTHTLYVGKREVDLLPLRRVLTGSGKLRESVILLGDLAPKDHSLLLRVKYVALDFTCDFEGSPGIVPGRRFVGQIPLHYDIVDGRHRFRPQDKFMVFPYSTCWIQKTTAPCENCLSVVASDISSYKTHRRAPCKCGLVYGKLLNGGLQDYVRVPSPTHSLVKIPELVSVHDACFLFDVALPFLAFCVDVLGPLSRTGLLGRVLVLLDDISTQSNDCLLVIQHLELDQLAFTFTDAKTLAANPEKDKKYRAKFPHVLVFSTDANAGDQALMYSLGTGLTLETSRLTIALFRDQLLTSPCPDNRKVYRPKLSFKDKFLMEDLLATLASLNKGDAIKTVELQPGDPSETIRTAESSGTSSSTELGSSDQSTQGSPKSVSAFSNLDISSKISKTASPKKRHMSWLHCERDFRLCLDDNCVHGLLSKCQQTLEINEMIMAHSNVKRAFYTHRLTCHVKLNAFIF